MTKRLGAVAVLILLLLAGCWNTDSGGGMLDPLPADQTCEWVRDPVTKKLTYECEEGREK